MNPFAVALPLVVAMVAGTRLAALKIKTDFLVFTYFYKGGRWGWGSAAAAAALNRAAASGQRSPIRSLSNGIL